MKENLSETESLLHQIIQQFLADSGAERARLAVTHEALLDRDLGIGSLEKVELFSRIEQFFDIELPESVISRANSVKDIAAAMKKLEPSKKRDSRERYEIPAVSRVDPSSLKTLVEVLSEYASHEPDRTHIYLQDETGDETRISYGKLYDEAASIAQGLLERGLRQSETVAIMLPTCADFFYSFMGVLLAGGIPVPIYPPFRLDQVEEYSRREAKILRNAEVRFLITFHRATGLSKLLRNYIPSLREVTTVDLLKYPCAMLQNIIIKENDPALIQYTSGSTGNPKGVLLTHYNLLSNIRAYGQAIPIVPGDVIVSWLPLYHDMGLIGAWFGSFYHGLPVIIMPPMNFLTRPESWLWAIHNHRGTLSGAPNFAYELCVKKIDEKSIEGLDLSSWRVASNGAEAIYPKTLERFSEKFNKYGFKPGAHFPNYGLAENSLALTFPPAGRGPVIDRIKRIPFETEQRALPAASNEKQFLEFVSCGMVLPGHEIRITGDNGECLGEREAGSLQFRGPSSMQGYYRNTEATEAIFHNGWWDSGDAAYMAAGEVYITGRKKDMIIKGGHNIYPFELEEIAGQVRGIRKGCVVAFGVTDAKQGTEELVLIAETKEENRDKRNAIYSEVIKQVTEVTGMPPDHVVLVEPKIILKTSSGKLRRSECKKMYLDGKLGRKTKPVLYQVAKIFLLSQFKKFLNLIKLVVKFLYTACIGSFFVISGLLVSLCVLLFRVKVAKKILRYWSKMIILISGCPFIVTGKENMPDYPVIFALNHASYIDFLVSMALLPDNIVFVAKSELMKNFFLGTMIKKLGHVPVERFDFSESLSSIDQLKKSLAEGNSIVIFVEGTFSYATGLRPFKLGAFKLAIETDTPVCPVSFNGTRHILHHGTLLLKPGIIRAHISKNVVPAGSNWDELIRLRNLTRSEIAKHCGEPVLDSIQAGGEE